METPKLEVSTSFWKKLICTDETPSARSGHSSVTFDSKLFIFGGHDGSNVLNDHYCLNLITLKWTRLSSNSVQPNVPSARASHASCLDPLTGIIYVFAGTGKDFGQSNKKDMFFYCIGGNVWSDVKCQGSVPSARYGHSLTLYKASLYLFGGTSGEVYFNDFYLFHIETRSWVQLTLNNRPSIRYKHSAKVLSDHLLIIGGSSYKEVKNDIWSIDLKSHECHEKILQKSEICGKFTQAAEVFNRGIYILGASSSFKEKASLWKLDLDNAKWTELRQFGQRPARIGFFSMNILDAVCIIFGGNDNGRRLNETFIHRLDIILEDRLRTFESLFFLITVKSPFNDVTIISEGQEFFINSKVLQVRAFVLSQKVRNTGNGLILPLSYPSEVVKALIEYLLCDKVSPVLHISAFLQLLSLSVVFCIPVLAKITGDIISRSISEVNVREIANYLASHSVNRLLHRQEIEENLKSCLKESKIAQSALKHVSDCFDMTVGERVYWLCVEALAQFKVKTNLNEEILNDLKIFNSKDLGRARPKKTNLSEVSSDLEWAVGLLYEEEKDFVVRCQDGEIRAHAIVLAAGSVYFEQMLFTGTLNECRLECLSSDLDLLINYFYFGLDKIKSSNPQKLADLLPLSDFLQVKNKDLHDFVGTLIREDLSTENVFDSLLLASRTNSKVMSQVIYEYFLANYAELVQREEMLGLPVQVLVELHRWRAAKSSEDGEF
jgi:hypothetical protein